jgi:hypothetical protein
MFTATLQYNSADTKLTRAQVCSVSVRAESPLYGIKLEFIEALNMCVMQYPPIFYLRSTHTHSYGNNSVNSYIFRH